MAKAVVVGAGFGGLAAAVRLAARGHRVTLVERQAQLGGRAMVFRDQGFTFDAGPTVITAPFLFEELFALAGRSLADYVELVPVDPFYRVLFPDGRKFDYSGDGERMLEQVRAFEPRDVDGFIKLRAHADQIYSVGFEKLADAPFSSLSDMLRAVPAMVRLRSNRSVYRAVSGFLRSPELRQVFTFQPLLVGGHPFRTSSIYLLIQSLERKHGVHFPIGGTGALVNALAELCSELGVETRTLATVDEIEVQRGGVKSVRLQGGEKLDADLVVCNADPPFVYSRLLGRQHRRKHTDARLARLRYSMGLFVVYFGARRTWPELAHHTIVLSPRYRELLDDIFDGRGPAKDPSLYLHAPTRTDPLLAPEGGESFYALAPVPNNQGRPVDWGARGDAFRDQILAEVEARAVPGLRGELQTVMHLSPDHFESELLSTHGAGFSIAPTLRQSAYLRFHNQSEDVRGLYFVGAGTHPGAGVPGVLCSAKVLDRLIPAAPGATARVQVAA